MSAVLKLAVIIGIPVLLVGGFLGILVWAGVDVRPRQRGVLRLLFEDEEE